MNWTLITSVFSILFKWWVNREGKRDRAEQQIIKLANKMDKMAQKRAKLKIRVDELEKQLVEDSRPK